MISFYKKNSILILSGINELVSLFNKGIDEYYENNPTFARYYSYEEYNRLTGHYTIYYQAGFFRLKENDILEWKPINSGGSNSYTIKDFNSYILKSIKHELRIEKKI